MTAFVATCEGAIRRGLADAPDAGSTAIRCCQTDAYLELKSYEAAEAAYRRTLAWSLAAHPYDGEAWRSWADHGRLAIRVGRGQRREAWRLYASSTLRTEAPVVVRSLISCSLWLCLWLATDWRRRSKWFGRTGDRCALLCLTPLVFFAFGQIIRAANGRLLYGDPMAVLAGTHTGPAAGVASVLATNLMMLSAAWIISRLWLVSRAADGPSEERRLPNAPTFSRLQRVAACAAVIVAGVGLKCAVETFSLHWPTGVVGHRDPMALLSFIDAVLISPAVQEVLFRRTILPRLVLAGGPVFGVVFSALVFAGCHNRLDDYYRLTWAGIVYAVQFLRTRSLVAPTVTHMVFNAISLLERG
jgi:membrane protease YdiL (CAAX protease family)